MCFGLFEQAQHYRSSEVRPLPRRCKYYKSFFNRLRVCVHLLAFPFCRLTSLAHHGNSHLQNDLKSVLMILYLLTELRGGVVSKCRACHEEAFMNPTQKISMIKLREFIHTLYLDIFIKPVLILQVPVNQCFAPHA